MEELLKPLVKYTKQSSLDHVSPIYSSSSLWVLTSCLFMPQKHGGLVLYPPHGFSLFHLPSPSSMSPLICV